MATQTRDKSAENGRETASALKTNGSGGGSDVASDLLMENHPLASVIGSFRNDLASLDAIMAGVEKYRQQMEAEEDPSE